MGLRRSRSEGLTGWASKTKEGSLGSFPRFSYPENLRWETRSPFLVFKRGGSIGTDAAKTVTREK